MKSEAVVQAEVRLEASRLGVVLWRNNVGAVYSIDNRFVRFGLANESKALNTRIKSADLVGMMKNGKFLAVEVKKESWIYMGTPRERAQLAFLRIVNTCGGRGFFINDACSLQRLLTTSIKNLMLRGF